MISISGGFGRLGLSGLFRCRVSFSFFDYTTFSPFLPVIVYPPLDSSKRITFGVAVLPGCLDLILREKFRAEQTHLSSVQLPRFVEPLGN